MPHSVINARISRAWKHAGETDRIHFIIEYPEGAEDSEGRHCIVDKEKHAALYDVLDSHIDAATLRDWSEKPLDG